MTFRAETGIISSEFCPSSLPLQPPENVTEPTQESTLQLPFTDV